MIKLKKKINGQNREKLKLSKKKSKNYYSHAYAFKSTCNLVLLSITCYFFNLFCFFPFLNNRKNKREVSEMGTLIGIEGNLGTK